MQYLILMFVLVVSSSGWAVGSEKFIDGCNFFKSVDNGLGKKVRYEFFKDKGLTEFDNLRNVIFSGYNVFVPKGDVLLIDFDGDSGLPYKTFVIASEYWHIRGFFTPVAREKDTILGLFLADGKDSIVNELLEFMNDTPLNKKMNWYLENGLNDLNCVDGNLLDSAKKMYMESLIKTFLMGAGEGGVVYVFPEGIVYKSKTKDDYVYSMLSESLSGEGLVWSYLYEKPFFKQ